MALELVRSSTPRANEPLQPPSTPFARRLFAAICVWLALSVAIGVLRAPAGWQAFEHPSAASQADGRPAG